MKNIIESRSAGQIVRIYLENFMSYDSVEINPSNNLNLIIGPNGTGKSSLVCAVLLGLGGKLKTLGRADHLSSYVKSGCDQCCIEIELYEPKGKNVVIKRKILSNNQSEFIVNEKVCNLNKINTIRKNYNIQIDNLCTFLPQEKVQDFAKLNPQQLLDQTQRTVGNGDLVQLHEELKILQSRCFEQEKCYEYIQIEVNDEKQKNDRLKDRVKCFKEKQSLCEKLVVLNQKKAWVSYELEVKKKEEIDKDCNLAEEVYNSKKQEIEKLDKIIDQIKHSLSSHEKKLSQAKKEEAGKKVVFEEWVKRGEQRLYKLEGLRSKVEIKLKEEEEKKEELLRHQGNIEKLTNDLKTLEANFGPELELRSQKEKVDQQMRNIHAEEIRLNQIKLEMEDEEDILSQELRNTTREYEHLKKSQNIRLDHLKKHEPDVYRSIEWLEQNKHMFHSQIYNPMLLELNVPNPKMAKYVEALVGYRDLISFTCTNPDDLNLLIKKLRVEQKLKVNAICSDEFDNTQYSPEISITDLKTYGFYSYVKDLVTGPEDIIRFLCKTYGIHFVPVGDERVRANCERVPQNISLFYSENDAFSVKYSVYSGEKSVTVKKLDEPKYFVESSDEIRIQILMDRQKDLHIKLTSKQGERKEVDNQLRKLRESLEEVKRKKRQLGTAEEERQQIQRSLNRAKTCFNSVKKVLKDPAEIEREANLQREALIKEIQKNLEELKKANEDSANSILIRQTCELEYRINTFEMDKVLKEKAQCLRELSRKEVLLKEIKERQKTAEIKCLHLKEKATKLTENVSIGDQKFHKFKNKFAELPNTLADIEDEIVETQVKADFLSGENFEILQEYEKREETIAQLTDSLEKSKKALEEKLKELNSKQDKWLNPVNKLISSINENFSKFFETMGCAGEVCLVSGENKNDFDQYGIKIFVKFRAGEPLQELGRYFQSGGERAVATAVFMLSLQELTSVPFRFVDEINQGMDPENERRILQLIISVTASECSTQYFFITPKLLPHVEWSKTMTVLCIFNGPHAVSATEWNMKEFLNKNADPDKEDEDKNSFRNI